MIKQVVACVIIDEMKMCTILVIWFMDYRVFVLTIQLLYIQVWFMDYRVFVINRPQGLK
jgi:hypothetical protein